MAALAVPVPPAAAQRLDIKLQESLGEVSPIVWGRVTADTLQLGGKTELRERITAADGAAFEAPPAPLAAPVASSLPGSSGEAKPLEARFMFKENEQASCTRHTRYVTFLSLVQNLKPRIARIRVLTIPTWDHCTDQIEKQLAASGIATLREEADGNLPGLVVHFHPVVIPKGPETTPAASIAERPKTVPAGSERTPAPIRVSVHGREIKVFEDGYFVFLASHFRPQELSVEQDGYKPMLQTVMPEALALGTTSVPPGLGFAEIMLTGRAEASSIAMVKIPPSARMIVLDMTAGLGAGYGHGLPGEVRGRRGAVAMEGMHRDLLWDLGARLTLEATSSSDSVVPWTVLGTGTMHWKGEGGKGSWFWRVGLGGQLFVAKIAPGDIDDPAAQAVAPELVISPLLSSASERRFGDLVVGGQFNFTPLYVAGAGFYPSYNPSVELGYMLDDGAALMLGLRSAKIRYPAIGREVALRLETLYLSLRQGF